ncbi:hypothetical protein HBI24_049430 [Parastagonospora nodorum]|nr:hypothetical protein HBH69_111020 [Parastagonospora nodorum]KAH5213329.1 hypothetical protein HBH77_070440 [Parastagonospora nodorum]KAH5269050.1 hypothetical protein HBI72_076210 [Parastagonospora nodorum]KAH5589386.1 hypothetical protein HBI24_049430 [Parastagonospora nodorum]KAH5647452.1 hypothetical protein HBI23_181280 [Parastagonospora nodorum]
MTINLSTLLLVVNSWLMKNARLSLPDIAALTTISAAPLRCYQSFHNILIIFFFDLNITISSLLGCVVKMTGIKKDSDETSDARGHSQPAQSTGPNETWHSLVQRFQLLRQTNSSVSSSARHPAILMHHLCSATT